MNDKLNMDKHIREKLDGFSVAPPPHVWDNIQGQMFAQRKKRRLVYIGWISAAAVVVFAFVAGWFFNEKSGAQLSELVEQEIVQSGNNEADALLRNNENELKWDEVLVSETEIISNEKEGTKSGPVITTRSTVIELEIDNAFVASIERLSYNLLESLEAIFIKEENDVILAERKDVKKTETTFATGDEILIAQNLKSIQKQNKKENAWVVGAHVSPGYSSQSTSHGEQYAQNMSYTADNGNGNIGGGLSVQYKTSKRLRIESGIYYSQNGQSSNNDFRGLFGFDNKADADYLYAAPEIIDETQPAFSNVVALNNNGIAMNSAAGVINMRSAPKGTLVATNTELANAKYANTLTTNGEFSQVFEFVEVPLYLRYSVLDKRFGIELMGGVNAGFIVGNNAYIDNDYGKQNIGSTEDISTLNFSGTIGLGVNYMLGKHISLAVEPRVNYYLNSINSNPEVSYRPYRVGVFTGIYYEF